MKSLTYYKYQKYNLLKSLNAKRKIFRSYKGKNTKSPSRTFRKTACRLALALKKCTFSTFRLSLNK